MAKFLNSILRTLIVSAVFAGLVLLGFWKLTSNRQQQTIDELSALNTQMQNQMAQREAMIQRLSRSRRVAHLEVLDQTRDESGTIARTRLLFIELDQDGMELARQIFTLPGDVVFLDAWTVKFDPERVAEGDPLCGKTLVLLHRVYTDRVPASEGLLIDTPGAVPPGYAASDIGRFEQQIWANFWEIATDRKKADQMGVRVAQGEAVYKPMRTGQAYELIVDAVGGMSLRPMDSKFGSEGSLTRASP